jgi:hypothetical protein
LKGFGGCPLRLYPRQKANQLVDTNLTPWAFSLAYFYLTPPDIGKLGKFSDFSNLSVILEGLRMGGNRLEKNFKSSVGR